jgi:type VI secretion system protein ImpK
MSPPAQTRRSENLALIYQEVLTAIVKFRRNPQQVADPNAFRHHMMEALRGAANHGIAAGYQPGDIKLVTLAAVAFLDESVLNSQSPMAADWRRKPVGEELFHTHTAGIAFFDRLQELLSRTDSADVADVLEVYYLCLLLGFAGRYSASPGELKQGMRVISDKIRRIRGAPGPLAPDWTLPEEQVQTRRDPWVYRMGIAAIGCFVLMVLLFLGYKLSLNSGISEMRNLLAHVGK